MIRSVAALADRTGWICKASWRRRTEAASDWRLRRSAWKRSRSRRALVTASREVSITPVRKKVSHLPVAIEPDILKKLVISLPVAFEMKGEVEERLAENPFCAKDEGDKEAAIAIKKRVDGLELNVRERSLQEWPGGDRVARRLSLKGRCEFKENVDFL